VPTSTFLVCNMYSPKIVGMRVDGCVSISRVVSPSDVDDMPLYVHSLC
jgi:hypothetical protein